MASDQCETTGSGESQNQDSVDYAGEGLSHNSSTYLSNLDAHPSTSKNVLFKSNEPRKIEQNVNQAQLHPSQPPGNQSPNVSGTLNFNKSYGRQLSLPASLGISPNQTNQLSLGLSCNSITNLDEHPTTSTNSRPPKIQVINNEPRTIKQNVSQAQIQTSRFPGNQSPNVSETVNVQELSSRELNMHVSLGIKVFTQTYQIRHDQDGINSIGLLQRQQQNDSSNKHTGAHSVNENIAVPSQSGMAQSTQSIQASSLSADNNPHFSPLTSGLTLKDRWLISEEYVNLTQGDPDTSDIKSETYLLRLIIMKMKASTIQQIIQNYNEIVGREVEDDGYYEYFVDSEQNQGKEEALSVCVQNRDIILLLDYENLCIFFAKEDNLKCIKDFFKEIQKQKLELLIWICINALHFTESQDKFFNELRKNAKTLVSRTLGIAENAADNGIFIILIKLHPKVTPSGVFFVFSADKVFNKLNGCPLFGGRNLQVIDTAEALSQCQVQPVEKGISNIDLFQHISNTFKDFKRTVYILDSSKRSLKLLNNLTQDDVDNSWIIVMLSEKREPPFVPFNPVEKSKRLKVLKKAKRHIIKAAQLIQCYEGQAPIMIMGLIVYMLERLGESADMHIFTSNKPLFVSFEQQLYKAPGKLTFNYEVLPPTKKSKKKETKKTRLNIF